VWLAHALTLSRVPLAAVFWVVASRPTAALVVLGAAALTDLADGPIARRARRRGASGRFADAGAWLDPMCDKLFAVVVLVALAVHLDTPIAILALIAAREIIVVPLVLAYRVSALRHRYHHDFHAAPVGKVATAAQLVGVAAILLGVPGIAVVAVVVAALGLIAAFSYLARAAYQLRLTAPPR
jgi:cardiolipin synthase (CMP-forming)